MKFTKHNLPMEIFFYSATEETAAAVEWHAETKDAHVATSNAAVVMDKVYVKRILS